ncbi:uncharacterized protein DC041_0007187 [Schistosoma bovis]|uniref:Glycosyl hydrolase family 31 C-terminal domain-containing protein n=1 Tax=Schistosoma bovis TaxID=6184 RepID=A0A430Q0N1_SCHBO|nr:uncharacterized protein DC041_0007187 [Schistosoma bovis]
MLGSCILVTPVLDEGRTFVEGYVPSGEWIELSTGKRYFSRGTWKYFDAPLNVIPISIRCGCIVPIQVSAETTDIARKKGFGLFVILSSTDDGSSAAGQRIKASGELFWDNGDDANLNYVHVKFEVRDRTLTVTSTPSSVESLEKIDLKELDVKTILIVGFIKKPAAILVNNKPVDFMFDNDLETCQIKNQSFLTLIPIQVSAETTDIARKKGFGLFVILSSTDDESSAAGQRIKASGELFWDNGDDANLNYVHVKFEVRDRTLTVTSTPSSVESLEKIDLKELDVKTILIVGFIKKPAAILVNNKPVDFMFDNDLETCQIKNQSFLTLSKEFMIKWRF